MNQDIKALLIDIGIQDVIRNLHASPERIATALRNVDRLKCKASGARDELKAAEASAEVEAWVEVPETNGDGKKLLADERKARIKACAAKNPGIAQAQKALIEIEKQLSEANAEFEKAKIIWHVSSDLAALCRSLIQYGTNENGKEEEKNNE